MLFSSQVAELLRIVAGVDAVLRPAAHAVGHSHDALGEVNVILAAFAQLLWMGNHVAVADEAEAVGEDAARNVREKEKS